MNQRVRSPRTEERLHRFLRPGALARLRDSRIRPRSASIKVIALNTSPIQASRLTPPSSPAAVATPQSNLAGEELPQIPALDGSPCFAVRIYGPRFPQRKKLVASKGLVFLPSPSVVGLETNDSLLDAFNADLLVAH